MIHYAVIGSPVSHSRSPQMFNAAFTSLGLNARYERVDVCPDDLGHFVDRMRAGEFAGCNVTMPHKQAIIPLLDRLSSLAQNIRAVNTVCVRDNKLIGDNTDCPGFMNALKKTLALSLKNANVIIMGAGGAARAISYGLCQTGIAQLTVINRDAHKAQELVHFLTAHFPLVACTAQPWSALTAPPLRDLSLIVNTTSLGMPNNPWGDTGFVKMYPQHVCVADIVTSTDDTTLLAEAKMAGHNTLSGLSMLVEQAVLAFEVMTGLPAPVEIMRRAVEGEE